jgi:hypothetical protein
LFDTAELQEAVDRVQISCEQSDGTGRFNLSAYHCFVLFDTVYLLSVILVSQIVQVATSCRVGENHHYFYFAESGLCKDHPKTTEKPLDKPLCKLKSRRNILTRRKGTVIVVAKTAKIIILYLLLALRILQAH